MQYFSFRPHVAFLYLHHLCPLNSQLSTMSRFILLNVFLFALSFYKLQLGKPGHDANRQNIPLGGNAWVSNGGKISKVGLENWNSPATVCTVYLRPAQAGKLKLSLLLNTQNTQSSIKVTLLKVSKTIKAAGFGEKEYFLGEWVVKQTGYVAIEIRGLSKTGADFGTLSKLVASGSAVTPALSWVQNNDDNYFYWGRRGPSVHLSYNTDGLNNIEWFYNEITVPTGNDVIGSYFMANGFAEGYFGFQVNSETERRVLFSVWSPFNTDNPKAIPEDQKIIMLRKGQDVYTGEFGNEGAGGQSYLKYNWKAGNTYRFLLQGKPVEQNYTQYNAYFYAPEENKWRLIANFKRPKTSTYLKRLHSFLENFVPETGNTARMALYHNQWALDTNGKWIELNKAKFTGDQTARKNFRKDYAGGLNGGNFFLKNCGFFNEFVALDQQFVRPLAGKQPVIDFAKLP